MVIFFPMSSTTDAKNSFRIYLDQLCLTLAPRFNTALYDMYCDATKHDMNKRMETFMYMLNRPNLVDVPSVEAVLRKIENDTQLWLRPALKQMVTQHIIILMATRFDKPNTKIVADFEVPETIDVLKRLFSTTCTRMRGHVRLYDHVVAPEQRVVNTALAEKHIKKCICEAFGYIVPFEQIIRQHLCSTVPEPAPQPDPEPMLVSEAPMDDSAPVAEPVPVEVDIVKTPPEPEPEPRRKRAKIID
jgi:hypothetical protein